MKQSDEGSIRDLEPGILDSVYSRMLLHMEGDLCHGLTVLAQVRWLIGDGISVDVSEDVWISNLPLSHWSTYVCMEMDDHLRVCDLLTVDGRCWRAQDVSQLFGG